MSVSVCLLSLVLFILLEFVSVSVLSRHVWLW